MNSLNAMSGWLWIKRGFQIFRKQPAEMLTLFFIYMFFNMGIGVIPVIGQFLPFLLIPVFTIGFMQACRQIEAGERVYPNLLLTGFRSPALANLLKLGVFYVVAAVLAIVVASLVDHGAFWKVVSSIDTVDPKALPESTVQSFVALFILFFLPSIMVFWYAAPLIAWDGMSVIKAIFYSFFAVKHAAKSFLVYGLSLVLINVLSSIVLSLVVAIVGGNISTLMIVSVPVSIVIFVVMYCSFYPTYTDVFVPPDIGTHIEEIV